MDPMAEIRLTFDAECEDLLAALDDGLKSLSGGDDAKDTVNAVFRAVHSIKGGAGAFGLTGLVNFAHAFETVLDELRSGRIAADAANVTVFFRAADHLADLLAEARGGAAAAGSTEAALLEVLADLAARAPAPDAELPFEFVPTAMSFDLIDLDLPPEPRSFAISFRPNAGFFASGNEPLYILRALSELGAMTVACDLSQVPPLDQLDPQACHLGWQITLATTSGAEAIAETGAFIEGLCTFDITPLAAPPAARHQATEPLRLPPGPEATPLPDPTPDPAPGAWIAGVSEDRRATPGDHQTTVRVDLDRIDRLVNLVGELVITQAMLAQEISAAGLARHPAIALGLEEFLHLSRNIQDSVMMIRAQPIKPLFARMARIVRDVSADSGKSVRLCTEGETTEIDKTLVERLAEPLTHMIRNAIDHGVETPRIRVASGKPAEGTVTLSASHRSGRVVIEVSDDGAGIDRPKVVATAIRKGLIAAEAALSDAEIDALLFLPGFSTTSAISNLSGRGVGMDVVKNAVQQIGGRISIASDHGKGTRFSISLPLTLAVLEGMVVQVAGEKIVVPLSAIIETLSLGHDDIRDCGPANRIVRVRDSFVPLLDLGVELGYRTVFAPTETAVVLVIARDDTRNVAVIVDRIEEQRQVVIKGFEKNYGRVPGIAAATILGDGSIALILDPTDFVELAAKQDKSPPGGLALQG